MNEIKITLSVEETNMTLAGLAKLPYEASAGVIDKIRNQAIPQAVPAAESVQEEATTEPQLLTE